jgi:hypothetical protein
MENQLWNRLRNSKDRSPTKEIVMPSAYDSVDDGEALNGQVQFTPPMPATAYDSVDDETVAFKYSSPLARSRAPLYASLLRLCVCLTCRSSGQDILLKFSKGFNQSSDPPDGDDPTVCMTSVLPLCSLVESE